MVSCRSKILSQSFTLSPLINNRRIHVKAPTHAAKTASKRTFAQASAVDESIRDAQETTANPYAARVKKARTLQTRAKDNVKKSRVGADEDETAEPSAVKKINQKADEFSEGSGGELNKEILKMLRNSSK